MMRRATVRAAWVLVAAALASAGPAGDDAPGARREEQAALKAYGPLVGSWRGTGQPQRGRSAGAWTESASVAWKLSADSAALEIDVAKGKYLKAALLKAGPKPGEYVLDATLADGSKRSFAGKGVAGKPLVLTAEGPAEGLKRVTLTIPNDLRFLLLLESAAGDGFARLGEVGFTRNGVAFAAGEAGPDLHRHRRPGHDPRHPRRPDLLRLLHRLQGPLQPGPRRDHRGGRGAEGEGGEVMVRPRI